MSDQKNKSKKEARLEIRISKTCLKDFREKCKQENITMSLFLKFAINYYLEKNFFLSILQQEEKLIDKMDRKIFLIGRDLNVCAKTINTINKTGEMYDSLALFNDINSSFLQSKNLFLNLIELLSDTRYKREQKNARLYLRLESTTLKKFKAKCAKDKVAMSAFLDYQIKYFLKYKNKNNDTPPHLFQEKKYLDMINHHVSRIGNNLNQCVLALNIFNKSGDWNGAPIFEDNRQLFFDCRKLYTELQEILGEWY